MKDKAGERSLSFDDEGLLPSLSVPTAFSTNTKQEPNTPGPSNSKSLGPQSRPSPGSLLSLSGSDSGTHSGS